MQTDESRHPTNDKHSLIHVLEDLIHIHGNETIAQEQAKADNLSS